ncbi:hypothetical protein CRYUN_Cryun07bG0187500 [Craigia yunnanensis]
MATVEAVAALSFSLYPSSSSKSLLCPKPTRLSSLTSHISKSTPVLSRNFSISPLISTQKKLGFLLCTTVQEVSVEAETEKTPKSNVKRKLFVLNLPWSFTLADIKGLFGQCGNVKDVEEVSGRIIRVEFARRFKKPSPPSPQPIVPSRETRHKLYVSNLAWKVRSSHLREFFSAFNPVSARVVFGTPSGQSAGYGFVSFATKEEAEAAVSTLNGKELMDRPLRLKFSERKDDEPGGEKKEEKEPDGQTKES